VGILLKAILLPVTKPARNPFSARKFIASFAITLILMPESSITAPPRGRKSWNLGFLFLFLFLIPGSASLRFPFFSSKNSG
jgi:hypothetical protein